jgi:murein DD-endopeptidase MepM/ murein hydrolase activator NlpD
MRIHPIRGGNDFHTGLDISTKPGEPVHVTADGIVSFSGWSGANGNLVAIEHGFGYETFYAHNKETVVKVGQIVKRGDVIAYVGSTGSSTGPHLHYEIWKEGKIINPKPFIMGRKQ